MLQFNGNEDKNKKNEKKTVQLKREMGLFSAINMILSVMIGSGIFISPTPALDYSGSVGMCIIVWIICGLVSLLGALAFAELGTVIPRSGAEYAYFLDSFGPLHKFWGNLPAFIYSWVMIFLIRPAEVAVIILIFAEYFSQPFLEHFCMQNEQFIIKSVALLALGLITFINVTSVKAYVKIQNVFGFFKIFACLIIIFGGFYEIFKGNVTNLKSGFEGTNWSARNTALAFYSGLWAYDGWSAVTTVTEEIKRPEVNIPKSIAISVPIVTILYVFMNVSYMTVMTIPEIVASKAVAVTFGDRILGPVSFLIPLGVALSTFGCALAIQFGVTRICYVAAQDGLMVENLSYIHYKKMTPCPAVVLQGFIAFIFIILGDIIELIEFASFLIWFFYGVAMVSLLILRRSMRNVPRPYKVPTIIPVFILLVAVFLTLTPIITDPTPKYFFALGYIFVGCIIYTFLIYKKRLVGFSGKLTRFVQILFEVVPPD